MRRPYTPPCLLILSKYTLAPMSSCRDICAVGPDSPADCPSRIRLAVTPVSACAGENNHTNSTGKIRNKQLRCRSCMRSPLHGLDRFRSCLAGTDANDLLNFLNENFAVANLAGACRLDDGVNDRLDHAVVDDNFDLHLGQEIDHIFSAAIQLSVALWTPKPLTSVTVRPVTPTSASDSRTSSNLNGLMTAVTCFMTTPPYKMPQ